MADEMTDINYGDAREAFKDFANDQCNFDKGCILLRHAEAVDRALQLAAAMEKVRENGWCMEIRYPWANGYEVRLFKMPKGAVGHQANGFMYPDAAEVSVSRHDPTLLAAIEAAINSLPKEEN